MPRLFLFAALAAVAVSTVLLALRAPDPGSTGLATCQGKPVTIAGNDSNNTINGTGGPDVISGGGGDDTINGNGGKDTICGEDDDDNIRGGKKNDKLSGGAGTDTVNGEAGDKDACEGETEISCERNLGGPPPGGNPTLAELFTGVTFTRPVDYDAIPGQPGDALIVQQGGLVRRVDEASPNSASQVFDAESIAEFDAEPGTEEGLLGLVFDPGYNGTTNQSVYIYYTAESPRRGELARYNFDGSGFSSGSVILEVPFSAGATNHNGGGLQFGPDGCIYLSVGEGGNTASASQDLSLLRGKVLRVNTSGDPCTSGGLNPFADAGDPGLDEIWAYGFRNPWRFSFDTDGKLWLGDVGQGLREEIDIVESGENYGWPICEGDVNGTGSCGQAGLEEPVAVYSSQNPSANCAITGGLVYRGSNANLASLVGQYIFGDYCAQDIRRTPAGNPGSITQVLNTGNNIVSFARDDDNEIIVITFSEIYRLQ